jgi:Icc-related predicted phosphoesterase
MRLLAAADTHGFEDVYRWIVAEGRSRQVDAVVLAGDLLGVPDGFSTVEDAMQASADSLKRILGSLECPVLYIMGNDDLVDLESNTEHCVSIHGIRFDLGGVGFVGYQCGPPFMRGPFEREEAELERELKSLSGIMDEGTVLITHYPAAGVLDAGFGLEAIHALIDPCPPLIHIHGHSHENFGHEGRHFNVASAGRKRAMVIDLETRTYQVVDRRGVHPSLSW